MKKKPFITSTATIKRYQLNLIKKTTPAEKILQGYLETNKIKFEEQYLILGTNNHFVFIDIYIPSCKLAIEVDGHHHHTQNTQIERDLKKEKLLRRFGIMTLRTSNKDVFDDPKAVINRITTFIKSAGSLSLKLAMNESKDILRNSTQYFGKVNDPIKPISKVYGRDSLYDPTINKHGVK